MHTYVYASQRRAGTYVWLRRREQFELLPEALRTRLGELRFVLDTRLEPTRTLPNADTAKVLEALTIQGWYLQLPPDEPLDGAAIDQKT